MPGSMRWGGWSGWRERESAQAVGIGGCRCYHEIMKKRNPSMVPKRGRVSEPVQVYLAGPDLDRLERLASRLGATKSDVLRRGLSALEAESVAVGRRAVGRPIPTFGGTGLRDGVDLDRMAELLDRLDADDAAR